jgi:amino acid transporter
MPKKILFVVLGLSFFLLTAATAYGQTTTPLLIKPNGPTSNCPENYQGNCGNYELDDFARLAINASRIVMGLVGTLSLLMFVYGGLLFLISAGGSEKIQQATKIITAAVIGLVIVFASFLIIKFVLSSMGKSWNGEKLQVGASQEQKNIA